MPKHKVFKAKIIQVLPGSVAELFGIKPGDSLLTIDSMPLKDLLDYQFAVSESEKLVIELERKSGDLETIVVIKQSRDDLGLVFESAVFDKIKLCNNRCIFCFVDQQPSGLRESLYIKDDDYRLSYLQGTYITLTNLNEADIKRIEMLRLGPLFISVHSTDPEIRKAMLHNKNAGLIMDKLRWLNDLYIPVHAQIVVCPGYNDSFHLKRTLEDLISLDNVLSIAIVPVGITRYRSDSLLKPFTKDIALETLDITDKINNMAGKNIAFPSDEIYLLAGKDLPEASFYEDFPQLEDGVGSLRLLIDRFDSLKLPDKLSSKRHVGLITASLAAGALKDVFNKLNNITNLTLDVLEIKSKFWGDGVSVAGLTVGQDIIDYLNSLKSLPEELIIPAVMLRRFSNDFLDGIRVSEIESMFNVKVHVIADFYSFTEVLEIIDCNTHC